MLKKPSSMMHFTTSINDQLTQLSCNCGAVLEWMHLSTWTMQERENITTVRIAWLLTRSSAHFQFQWWLVVYSNGVDTTIGQNSLDLFENHGSPRNR